MPEGVNFPVYVEPVQLHHLGPRRHEVAHKLLLCIRTAIDLGDCPQLREFEPNTRSTRVRGPLRSVPVFRSAPLEEPRLRSADVHCVPMSSRFTKKSLVSAPGRFCEHTVLRVLVIGAQHAQSTNQHRHLGRA